MNTFQKWCSDELRSIETQARENKTPLSTYLVDKIRHLKAGVRHGDELEYDLQIAMLDGNECEINRILADMRYRDADGAGYTK
jgi:hypothetical protein